MTQRMPKIASHHHPSAPMPLNTDYRPICDWPDDCKVQWGRSDTFAPHDGPIRAFFEAFPKNAGMVRGDAGSIEDAETKAFEKFQRESACAHPHIRRKFLNGLGVCPQCKASLPRAFKPVIELGSWDHRPNHCDLDMIASGWLRPREWRAEDAHDKELRRIYLKARRHGIAIPETPAAPMTEAQFMREIEDPYRDACAAAVEAYLDSDTHGLEDFYCKQILQSIASERRVAPLRIARAKSRHEKAGPE
jgi:hypothetical protein